MKLLAGNSNRPLCEAIGQCLHAPFTKAVGLPRLRAHWVRPEVVVEIAFNDLQESPQYPGGLALRFARVKGYRPDKTAAQADTIQTLRNIYCGATGRPAPQTKAGSRA